MENSVNNQYEIEHIFSTLKGAHAVVTGAASGIGKEVALMLAHIGCNVIACDINDEGLNQLRNEAKTQGLHISPRNLNLLDINDIKNFTDWVKHTYKEIQILINCAGLCTGTAIMDVEEDEWDRICNVNLKGLFFLSQQMTPLMQKGQWGRIINISSLAGFVGGILASPAYSASKAGVTCLTKTFAKYLAPHNITVNEVSPGTADTEMTHSWLGDKMYEFIEKVPLGRLVKAGDIAYAILFLVSPLSSFMTGQVVHVNGGMYMP